MQWRLLSFVSLVVSVVLSIDGSDGERRILLASVQVKCGTAQPRRPPPSVFIEAFGESTAENAEDTQKEGAALQIVASCCRSSRWRPDHRPRCRSPATRAFARNVRSSRVTASMRLKRRISMICHRMIGRQQPLLLLGERERLLPCHDHRMLVLGVLLCVLDELVLILAFDRGAAVAVNNPSHTDISFRG